MQLDGISDQDIVKLEIPTGAPIHYAFGEDGSIVLKEKLYE
jgi:2,3-bisphosphoglycerate-dependent phosphoglycerate mutase